RRDVLGDLKTQNKWATGIGLVNLGIEGMGGYARLKQVERQEGFNTLLAKHAVEMVDLKKTLYTDIMDILKKQTLLLSTKDLQDQGLAWHLIPKDQRIGDINETIKNLEPRKSDPFPSPWVELVKQLHKQGKSFQEIDKMTVDLINKGKLPSWQMHISD
ncbi:unnamed protein product, partial [marine sediment metagenome]